VDNSKISNGVDVSEINKIMAEIIDYATKLKSKFNRVDDIIYDTKSCYTDMNAEQMVNRYNLFKDDLNTMIENIMSYNTDLANLKSKYKNNVSTISEQIKKDTTNILDNGW